MEHGDGGDGGVAGRGWVWLGAAGGCYDTNRHVTCHVTQCVDNR